MNHTKLKPYLTPLGAFGLALGCAVGWGAFIMPATVFLPIGGPLGVALGMGLGGVVMLLIGYNYHYMMNRHKDSGGTYAFSKFAFGYDHGFIASWFLLLVFIAITLANVTALALIFRNLAGDFLKVGYLYTIVGFDVYFGEILAEILAMVVFSRIASRHKALAVKIQTIMAVFMLFGITVGLIAAVNVNGMELFTQTPHFAINKPVAVSILGIVALAPWAFAGFESISNSTEEFKFDVAKSFKIMAAAIVAAIFAYVALSFVAISATPYAYGSWLAYINNLDGMHGLYALPVFHAVDKYLGTQGLVLLGVTLFCGVVTGLLGNTIAASRLLYAMARDNLLPKRFMHLTSDGVPNLTVLMILLVSIPVLFLGRSAISWIIDVNSIGATIAYAYTSAAAYATAERDGNKLVKLTGGVGFLISAFFFLYFVVPWSSSIANLATESYLIIIAWSIVGFAFFRYIYQRDMARRFGKSTVVWIILLSMIFFTSLLWMRESIKATIHETLVVLNDHHIKELKERGIHMNQLLEKEHKIFLQENLDRMEGSLSFHNIVQLIIMIMSLYIMFTIYNMMMAREKSVEIEKTLMEKEAVSKSTFFFNMSHDIRTPMNAIVGYVNLMKKEEISGKTADYLNKIEMASDHLLSLINDILELSRIENGKFNLEIEDINIKDTVVSMKDLFINQMEEKGLKFEIKIDIKNEWVEADAKGISRVLLNLIGNAYKFTETGFVRVTMRELEKEEYEARTRILSGKTSDESELKENLAYYEIRVIDSGVGMSDAFAATVFEAYARERSASEIQGTGLGMSITKSVIELMGGSIRVESKKGKGSAFIINLALPIVKNPPKAENVEKISETEQEVDFNNLHVLLVEDMEMNREIAAMILSEYGMKVDFAQNGKIALEKVILSENAPYDLILMDIQMPIMNGYDCAKAIRRLNDERLNSIPIIAMTANAFQEDVENAKKAGMNMHVAKPLDVPKLMEAIKSVVK
ncbi:MAG: amino acid permease [Selenomonadaceae bacterium]|nr:amino acid permease [Selenomonadaceae bacterium]